MPIGFTDRHQPWIPNYKTMSPTDGWRYKVQITHSLSLKLQGFVWCSFLHLNFNVSVCRKFIKTSSKSIFLEISQYEIFLKVFFLKIVWLLSEKLQLSSKFYILQLFFITKFLSTYLSFLLKNITRFYFFSQDDNFSTSRKMSALFRDHTNFD